MPVPVPVPVLGSAEPDPPLELDPPLEPEPLLELPPELELPLLVRFDGADGNSSVL